MTDKGAKYIEGVGWRYETEHSMSRRMKNHDYQSRCIYMLTLTLADRKNPLLEGLLLMLAPWPYHMEKRTITRGQCLALNSMAQAISNEPWTQEIEDMLCREV